MKHIVPVSGGKDSQVVLDLVVRRHGPGAVVAVHNRTNYDHPDTEDHLTWMEGFYGVEIIHTQSDQYADVFDFIEKAGYFPNAKARGCTSRLKQRPFADWLEAQGYTEAGAAMVHLGMRSEESDTRGAKYGALDPEDDLTLPDISKEYSRARFGAVAARLDIVDWDTDRVFAHLRDTGARINPLYGRGHKRVGCYPCILAPLAEWQACANDPVGREHIRRLGLIQAKFEREGNPRKLVKVHRGKGVMSIVHRLAPETAPQCSWCLI